MSLGGAGVVFGDQDDLLADLGRLLEPLLEAGLGAVRLGGVEGADAAGVGQPEQAVEDAVLAQGAGAHLEQGDLEAGLAELTLGERPASCAGRLAPPRPEVALRAAAVASGTGLKERAAVGAVGLVVGHRFSTPRWMGRSIRVCVPDERILARPDRFRTVNRRGKRAPGGRDEPSRLRKVPIIRAFPPTDNRASSPYEFAANGLG